MKVRSKAEAWRIIDQVSAHAQWMRQECRGDKAEYIIPGEDTGEDGYRSYILEWDDAIFLYMRFDIDEHPPKIEKRRTWCYEGFTRWRKENGIKVEVQNSNDWQMIKTIIDLLPPTDENIYEVARLLDKSCLGGKANITDLMSSLYDGVVVTDFELTFEDEEADYENT